jgi:hypothetical protein
MIDRTNNERGSAMVLAIGVLAVLAVLAAIILTVVVAEKRTAFSEYANKRAFYSADAASEAGVNWIQRQASPPALVDSLRHVYVAPGFTSLTSDHRYKYDVQFVRRRFRPGWSVEYKDFEYRVDATGVSAQQSESAIELTATRLYREGY